MIWLTIFCHWTWMDRKSISLETGELTGHSCKVLADMAKVSVRIMALEMEDYGVI